MSQQHEILRSAPLLNASGDLAEPGWARSLLPVYRRSDIRVISIPADSMALEIGSTKTANVIIFAVYIVASGTIPVDRAKEIALAKLAKKPQFAEMNNPAFDRGVALANSHK